MIEWSQCSKVSCCKVVDGFWRFAEPTSLARVKKVDFCKYTYTYVHNISDLVSSDLVLYIPYRLYWLNFSWIHNKQHTEWSLTRVIYN